MTIDAGLAQWHEVIRTRDPRLLAELLADDVVFHSPVVHRPQVGKGLTTMYLTGAMHVIANDSFTYVREVVSEPNVILEFTTEIDGVTVNGVDMIAFNDDGKIIDFKVMLRPMKGIEIVRLKMAEMLEFMKQS